MGSRAGLTADIVTLPPGWPCPRVEDKGAALKGSEPSQRPWRAQSLSFRSFHRKMPFVQQITGGEKLKTRVSEKSPKPLKVTPEEIQLSTITRSWWSPILS